jgi:monofunctional biosynthetic peptidoglycan transglycosylase
MFRFLRRMLRILSLAVLLAVTASVLLVLALRWINPPTSAFMLEARYEAWTHRDEKGARPFVLRQDWRDLKDISPQLAIAVVASEDQLFPKHKGFDVVQIRKAMAEAEQGGRTRGASTITQQAAKNLFLWSGHSWFRKGLEVWFTVLIETCWTKQRILEVYLNLIELGRGVYGAQAASKLYFGHDARTLSAAEAAQLAAVLPAPKLMNAAKPGPYVQSRREEIQVQMRQLGGPAYLKGIL